MGFKMIRVDSGTPPVLPEGMSYALARQKIVDNFKRVAKIAQKYGLEVVWEFEPGFLINEPKYILETYEAVNEPNFSILFDTCHGYMSAVVGARHIEPNKLEGGLVEFAEMLKGKIGLVHVIDSDGTLNEAETSTHAPFGLGNVDFDEIIPALLEKADYKGDWWAIDLCEWPDAWNVTADCKAFAAEGWTTWKQMKSKIFWSVGKESFPSLQPGCPGRSTARESGSACTRTITMRWASSAARS